MDSFMKTTSHLYSSNAAFIEALLNTYRTGSVPVPAEWRAYLEQLEGSQTPSAASPGLLSKQFAVYRLIDAFRFYGVFSADLDPLKIKQPLIQKILTPEAHGLSEADYDTVFDTGTFGTRKPLALKDLLTCLKRTYTANIGAEFSYIIDEEERSWLQERLECCSATPSLDADGKKAVLKQLTAAETLERYLGNRYVGAKRFGLEGCESVIPALNTLVQTSGILGIQEIVFGMAHRGRLNVLMNILGKKSSDLFEQFEDRQPRLTPSGDVKYHEGLSADIMTPGGPVHLALAYNPSHLECVNPVVAGSVRARQQRRKDFDHDEVLGVMIHGDSALSGLGVNYSILNMSHTRGFDIGGVLHIVINNQIGFTTSSPADMRSGPFCTDIAKATMSPVLHVNADYPEQVCFAIQIALDYRMKFKKDVFVDIVGFRRLGHNEADDPRLTQPLMYNAVLSHSGVRLRYARELIADQVVSDAEAKQMQEDYRRAMDEGEQADVPVTQNPRRGYRAGWHRYIGGANWTKPVETRISKEKIAEYGSRLVRLPPKFTVHPTVNRILDARYAMSCGNEPFDWGMAEATAFASLVDQNVDIRLSGEDCGRGTFSHRHAVWHNQSPSTPEEDTYCSLQNIREGQGNFRVIDSILNEEAVLSYEYGYACSSPDSLVIWEAQYGDFANGAQVVIDQFIAAAETKWGRLCRMVINLPHGSDGAGPEHSSARLERWLQLCAEDNMEIVLPSRSAQLFHLLRRQMLRPWCKPLVIFMSKRLLRYKPSMSEMEEFTHGSFHDVIGDNSVSPSTVSRVIFCSGQIYYDLLQERTERNLTDKIALIRIEKLYPFPQETVKLELSRYPDIKDIVWVQEEPRNQGAWRQIRRHLEETIGEENRLSFIGRPASPSPAVAYGSVHKTQLRNILDEAMHII